MLNNSLKQLIGKLQSGKNPDDDDKAVIRTLMKKEELDHRKLYMALYHNQELAIKDTGSKKKLSINKFRGHLEKVYKVNHGEDYIRKLINAERVNFVIGSDADELREPVLRPLTQFLTKKSGSEKIRRLWKLAKKEANDGRVTATIVERVIAIQFPEHVVSKSNKSRQLSENTRSSEHEEILKKIIPRLKNDYDAAVFVNGFLKKLKPEVLNKQDVTSSNKGGIL